MSQPFFIGQEVVAVRSGTTSYGFSLIKGQVYTVIEMSHCGCGWNVDIGERMPTAENCECGKYKTNVLLIDASAFRSIDRIRTKYVEKAVEVSAEIKLIEKCLS